MYKTKLTAIVKSIIDADSIAENTFAVKELVAFFEQLSNPGDIAIPVDNEAALNGGQALSSYHAAVCTEDYLRTSYFIKGVYRALNKLMHDFPGRPVNILYAGSGPFATLLLPLLPLFDKSRLKATLLDINNASLLSVQHLVRAIELQDYDLELVEANAITFDIPHSFPVDLLISETMHYALTMEPQVAIVQNLAPQLLPHSIMIPQEINITLGYSFYAKEPFLKTGENAAQGYLNRQPYASRTLVDSLFTINKDFFSKPGNVISQIKSKFYKLPAEHTKHPDICIFTGICVYEDIVLDTADSLITNPYCIGSMLNFANHSSFQVVYDFSETPKWTYNLKN